MRRPSLFFDIGANDRSGGAFSSLQSSLSETERRAQRTRQQIMAFGAAAVAAVTAVGVAALRGASQIDEVAKASRRLDMEVGSFRAIQLVASEAGVSVEGLANDIQNANREIERGSTGATNAARALGVSLADLRAMDTDTRMELIADRINELGMNAGEASVVLRDLGIRNREMVLMMMQGGGAFRAARRDINEYGLALAAVDTSRIEEANDRISRLGYISQFAADRLALAIVPALGSMANAIMESMREGGRLREFLEAVPGYATAAAIAITAYYTPAIIAATWNTAAWVASLVTLKGALLATGIGALIVGMGWLINHLIQLVKHTGGWGNALHLLGEVARAVWNGIKTSASSIGPALNAVWLDVQAGFMSMLDAIAIKWAEFLAWLNRGISGIPGMSAISERLERQTQGAIRFSTDAMIAAQGMRSGAEAAREEAARRMAAGFDTAREAYDRLMDAVNGVGEFTPATIEEITAAARDMNAALEQTPAAAGGATRALTEISDTATEIASRLERVASGVSGLFMAVIKGGDAARNAISRLLDQMLEASLNNIFMSLLGPGGAMSGMMPFLGPIFGGFRAAGGPVQSGRSYVVGERGPELFTPGASGGITPNHQLGGGTKVVINNYSGQEARTETTRGPNGEELIRVVVGRQIAQGQHSKAMGTRFGLRDRTVAR